MSSVIANQQHVRASLSGAVEGREGLEVLAVGRREAHVVTLALSQSIL